MIWLHRLRSSPVLSHGSHTMCQLRGGTEDRFQHAPCMLVMGCSCNAGAGDLCACEAGMLLELPLQRLKLM